MKKHWDIKEFDRLVDNLNKHENPTLVCVHCQKILNYQEDSLYFCGRQECPNYGLFQIGIKKD